MSSYGGSTLKLNEVYVEVFSYFYVESKPKPSIPSQTRKEITNKNFSVIFSPVAFAEPESFPGMNCILLKR